MNLQYRNLRATGYGLSSSLRIFALVFLLIPIGSASLHAQTVAYVANGASNSVSVVDTATNAVTATVPLHVTNPVGVMASPDGGRIYVTGVIGAGSGVDVIETSANTVIATVPLPAVNSAALPVITPDGLRLYVPDRQGGTVTVINTATNAVAGSPISAGSSCSALAITPDGSAIYVANPLDSAVVRIDTATNTAGPPILVGVGNPSDLVITPDGRSVYVSTPTPGESTVTVIDTGTNTITTQIPLPGSQELPFGLAVTPDGSLVYVAEQVVFFSPVTAQPTGGSGVLVIDTATNTFTTGIFFGFRPFKVSITPDGALLYVTDLNTASLTEVSTAKNVVVGEVPVGDFPQGIVIVNVGTPFAAFAAGETEINHHRFRTQGDFTLGAKSAGIDLAHQPVVLTAGDFSLTIPAGKFRQVGGQMHFLFRGTVNGLKVNFEIQAEGHSTDSFDFKVMIKGVDLTGEPNPLTLGLKIGNNTGTVSVPFEQDSDDNDNDNG